MSANQETANPRTVNPCDGSAVPECSDRTRRDATARFREYMLTTMFLARWFQAFFVDSAGKYTASFERGETVCVRAGQLINAIEKCHGFRPHEKLIARCMREQFGIEPGRRVRRGYLLNRDVVRRSPGDPHAPAKAA